MTRCSIALFLTICFSVSFVFCKKDKFLTDPSASVSFSQDSVLFDTVFTTIGSTTRNIRVINKNNQKVKISSVHLEKGTSSNFFMNVDGVKGKDVQDVEILANDSIYIFIQVNVDPTNQNSPLIITDKILFDINGNQQSVALEAWGQDAYYHFPNQAIQFQNGFLPYSTLASNTNTTVTWSNDKPHVIYGWLVVDSTQKLIINAGVTVYFHQNAGLWVYRYGTLQVNGTLGNEVTFRGDRREEDYDDQPGQWDRIWINEGKDDNHINYAVIKNGYIGIQATYFSSTINTAIPHRVKLTNTIIKNCAKWGIYTEAFNMWGANNVVANCKEYCGYFTLGGKSVFLQTTFANYFNKDKGRTGEPCVHLDNYVGSVVAPLDSGYFANCIIDGSQANELEISLQASTPASFHKFNSCVLKTAAFTGSTSVNNAFNKNMAFEDVNVSNFKLKPTSQAIGVGDPNVILLYPGLLSTDLKGSVRSGSIDAGAYQH